MRKAISILLAVTLMFALCVPAFADVLTGQGPNQDMTCITGNSTSQPQSATAIIKTSEKNEQDEDAASFKVCFPAQNVIPWGKEENIIPFWVESHLLYGQKVNVEVKIDEHADDNAPYTGTMKYTPEESVTLSLPYTISDYSWTADGPVVFNTADEPAVQVGQLKVNVTELDWNRAVVGEYSDNLRFTVSIVT